MLHKRRIILLGAALLVFSGSLIYYVEKKDTLYQESNNKAGEYQQKDDEITNSRRNIITETVKKVSPAIVGINVTQVVQYQDPFGSMFNDPFFKQFFPNQSYNQKVTKFKYSFKSINLGKTISISEKIIEKAIN